MTKPCAMSNCGKPRATGKLFCSDHVGTPTEPATTAIPAAPVNRVSRVVCSHCQTVGHVMTKLVKQKKGVSGGKLTGAILTGGISMLGTGLSRKEKVTEMHCTNCGTTWYV